MQDWRSVGDWKDGRVRSAAKKTIWMSLLFGIVFIGISLPAVLDMTKEYDDGNHMILLVLLFPLVGVSALIYCLYSIFAWRKFGTTELVLDPVPGSIGGDFGGYVNVPVFWKNSHQFNITLNCLHTQTTGSGKNRSTKTSVSWQREGIADISPTSDGTRCAFRFSIPDDLPESEKNASSYYHWLFQIECELPGIDFRRNFSVPVFKSETPQFSLSMADYAKASSPLDKAPEGTVIISETAEALQFYYPWYRHLWMGFMSMVFGSIFAVIGYFIGAEDAGGMVFFIAFGGVGIICLLIGLYIVGNTLTTTVSKKGINVVRNVYGIRFQRNVVKDNIVKLQRQIKSQMQGGSRYRVYYSIVVFTRDGRQIVIADTLEGSRLADFIEKRILTALHMRNEAGSLLDQWSP